MEKKIRNGFEVASFGDFKFESVPKRHIPWSTKKNLQAFIDEFCYRFNRRSWSNQLFARAMFACANASPFTRYDLIG